MRSAHSGPCPRWGLHNPHTRPASASRHSVSSRRRSFARGRRVPSPARGSGRSATGLRRWPACSVRSGRRPFAHHSVGGRGHAWPRGKAGRRSDPPPAGGGRRMYTGPPPSTPSAAVCRRRGRLCGTAPDRGRRMASPAAGLWHGGRARRRDASRHSRCIPCDRAREEAGRSGCTSAARSERRGAGGGGDPAPASSAGP